MENTNTEIVIVKRTHKKPYKVGKLYFGRRSTSKGAGWVVSSSEDLSNPVAEFEIGKLARAYCERCTEGYGKRGGPQVRHYRHRCYCEDQRDAAKNPAEIPINIPADTGFGNIFGSSGSEII